MSQTITGHFDGKVIIPDKPVKLPVGKPLRLKVDVAPTSNGKKNGKPKAKPPKPSKIKKIDRQRQFIGTGMFDSGIPDLGSNKKHLEGLGRK